MTRLVPALLVLAFPVLAHLAAITGAAWLALLAVLALALGAGWSLRHRPWTLLVLLGALAALMVIGGLRMPMFIAPVLIPAAVAFAFASSLARERRPLVARVIEALHPEALDDPAVEAFARRLTAAWALLLAAIALANLVLALLAVPDGILAGLGIPPPWPLPLAWWSLMANVISYLLIGGFFVLEYGYRRHRFPQQPYRNFGDFMARVSRLGPGFWRRR